MYHLVVLQTQILPKGKILLNLDQKGMIRVILCRPSRFDVFDNHLSMLLWRAQVAISLATAELQL